jgi:CysZ protein
VRAGLGGFRLVFSDGTLLGLSLIPMLVHVLLLVGLLAAGTFVIEPLGAWLDPPTSDTGTFWSTVGHSVWSVVAGVLVWVVVGAASLVGAVVIGSVVCDPFYDALSERTEALHLGRDVGAPFTMTAVVRGIGRELVVTVLRFAVWGSVAAALWLLAFTPLGVVTTPLSLLWTWLFFAWEFIARSMVRHVERPTGRFQVLFGHKALFAGFGAVAWALSFVPLTAPLLVVAATRLYLGLVADGEVPTTLPAVDVERLKARSATP